MSKRFTSTMKWQDPWFRKLPMAYKLFWQYLCDQCDNAGIWKCDYEAASFFIGSKIEPSEAVKFINDGKERLTPSNDGSSFLIKDFAEFQYGSFRESKHPFHKNLVKLIDTVSDRVSGGVYNTPQDKEKVQVQEKALRGFVKPTVIEVCEYIKEKGYSVDAEKWWNYYESNGWKVGRNPMKNWRAAIVTWSKNNSTTNQVGSRPSTSTPHKNAADVLRRLHENPFGEAT